MKPYKFIILIAICLSTGPWTRAHEDEEIEFGHSHGIEDIGPTPSLEELIHVSVAYSAMGTEVTLPEIKEIREEIHAAGDKAAPIIIEMLHFVEEPEMAEPMVTLLSMLKVEDKRPIRETFKSIVSGELAVPDKDFLVWRRLANMVRVFGEPSDTDWILPLLDHEDRSVRVLSVESLGFIGDIATAKKIEATLAARAASLSPEERAQAKVFKYGTQAIAQIKKRYPDSVAPTPVSTAEVSEKLPAINPKNEKEKEAEQMKAVFAEEESQKGKTKVWLWISGISILLLTAFALKRFSSRVS